MIDFKKYLVDGFLHSTWIKGAAMQQTHLPNDIVVINHLTKKQIGQLHQLYQGEWWSRTRTLLETRQCVVGSQICIGLATPDEQLVGFARVLTDYTFKASAETA